MIQAVIAGKTLSGWTQRFQTLKGQRSPVQNTLEVAADPQVRNNGYMASAVTKDGREIELVAAPVRFDEKPTQTARAPELNEHRDQIRRQIGLDEKRII